MRVPLLGLLLVQVAMKSVKGDVREALADSVSYQSDIDSVKALNARLSNNVKAINARLESRKAEAISDTKKRLSQESSESSKSVETRIAELEQHFVTIATSVATLATTVATIASRRCVNGDFWVRASNIPDSVYDWLGFKARKIVGLSEFGFRATPRVTFAIKSLIPKRTKLPTETFNDRDHRNNETGVHQSVELELSRVSQLAAEIVILADDSTESVAVSWLACGGL